MSFYYLIDFENVREAGISSLAPTDRTDHIYVFYTDNASKLNMDAFLNHEAELKFIKVAAGKQSLDMHLISVLGFLLRDQGEEEKFVIVSRDGGYDNVIRFWKDKGFAVSRDNANLPVNETVVSVEKPAQPKKSGSKRSASNRRNNSRKKEKQGQFQAEEIIDVTAQETTEAVAETAEEAITESAAEAGTEETTVITAEAAEESVTEVSAEASEEATVEPMAEVEEAETLAEPTPEPVVEMTEAPVKEPETEMVAEKEPEAAPEPVTEPDPHTAMNIKLMSFLRNKTDANTCGAIASIVVRNMDEKNYKQVIYRAMVRKFGQKIGLENYNLIKKEI